MSSSYDYIIVGGGLVGCALATRLAQDPTTKVLLLEAGPDATGDPRTTNLFKGFALTKSELDWQYNTVAQGQLNDREVGNLAGKCLGGGSILNYGGWFRGGREDYNDWAAAVGDASWNYEGFLPYLKKSETYHGRSADPHEHGSGGPIHVSTVSAVDNRVYGLKNSIRAAYTELGAPFKPGTSTAVVGICEHLENFRQGIRQPSNLAYGLKGVEVMTTAPVQKVLFSEKKKNGLMASGVQLDDGREFLAKEVILSAGAWRSPQILMLSGIGPAETLAEFEIPQVLDLPAVGKGMYDHFCLFNYFKLRDPTQPHSMGNPHWTDPAYLTGLPIDWHINEAVPADLLRPAIEEDNKQTSDPLVKTQNLALLAPGRAHVEEMTMYSPILPGLPVDGSIIGTSTMQLNPTSRGSITIRSASIRDHPVADPNYYGTAVDRVTLKYGVRRTLQALLKTKAGSEHVASELPPPGMPALTADSSDEEIDARIRAIGINHQHAKGSCPMGKVVDTKLKVMGIENLRVVDGSVFPVGVGGHPQATLYALAEKAADIILGRA